jgi:hypothetical protein
MFSGINQLINYRRPIGLFAALGEGGIAEASINGGAFATLESTRETTSGRVTLSLGANAANQTSVVVRFRVNANSTLETYDVDNVAVSGTQGSGNAGRPAIGSRSTASAFPALRSPPRPGCCASMAMTIWSSPWSWAPPPCCSCW